MKREVVGCGRVSSLLCCCLMRLPGCLPGRGRVNAALAGRLSSCCGIRIPLRRGTGEM